MHPPNHQEKIHRAATDSLIQQGIHPPSESGAQWNLVKHRNQPTSTAHQTGKNPDANSGLPQEVEGETDHFPRPLVAILAVKPFLLGLGSEAKVLCYEKVCKTPLRVNGSLSFSQEIVTTEVKGWITKKFSSKGGDSQENSCITHHSTG
jgi:hypothetical protein